MIHDDTPDTNTPHVRYTPYEHFPPPFSLAIYIFNPLLTGLLLPRSTFPSPPRPALASPFASWDIEHQRRDINQRSFHHRRLLLLRMLLPRSTPWSPHAPVDLFISHILYFIFTFVYLSTLWTHPPSSPDQSSRTPVGRPRFIITRQPPFRKLISAKHRNTTMIVPSYPNRPGG